MQVVLPHFRHPFPRGTAEGGPQVVRRGALLTVPPDVVVVVGVVPALLRFEEPGVLVGGVVQNEVEDDADAPLLSFGDEPVHIRERPEHRVDVPVVRDVVAVVCLGTSADRRQPDGVDAQFLQVVEPVDEAGDVPDAVSVRVLETPWVYLIDDSALPPFFLSCVHCRTSFVVCLPLL